MSCANGANALWKVLVTSRTDFTKAVCLSYKDHIGTSSPAAEAAEASFGMSSKLSLYSSRILLTVADNIGES